MPANLADLNFNIHVLPYSLNSFVSAKIDSETVSDIQQTSKIS